MLRSAPGRTVTAAAAVGAGVLLTASVAAAATGSLPGATQDTAQGMLAHVGVSVPGASQESAGHADQRGSADADAAQPSQGAEGSQGAHSESSDNAGKGDAVSFMARTTDAEGVDKGAQISDYASDGRSHAGEHEVSKPTTAGKSAGHAQVDTPNRGGATHPEHAGGQANQEQPQTSTGNRGGSDAGQQPGEGHTSAGAQNRH